jgi:lantibiotic modifying enzyme
MAQPGREPRAGSPEFEDSFLIGMVRPEIAEASPGPSTEDNISLNEAIAIGSRLAEARRSAKDGSISWTGPSGYGTEMFPLAVRRLNPYLGGGTAGVALFLAGLEKVAGDGGVDDLCGGHAGLAESLLEAAERLGDPGLAGAARSLAARMVRRARQAGGYELTAAQGPGHYTPAFLQGEPGIGYTLLRLSSPRSLPCTLSFH